MSPQSHRDIMWTAISCDLDGSSLYLGLTAGLDDVISRLVSDRQMIAFPIRLIRIVSSQPQLVPLRVYVVRDPALLDVTPLNEPAHEPDYMKVRLQFHINGKHLVDGESSAASAGGQLGSDFESPGQVMAFLVVTGLPGSREQAFYDRVVDELLPHTWASLPRLLRRSGCKDPGEFALKGCEA